MCLHKGVPKQEYLGQISEYSGKRQTKARTNEFCVELSLTFPLNENFIVLLHHIFQHGSLGTLFGCANEASVSPYRSQTRFTEHTMLESFIFEVQSV